MTSAWSDEDRIVELDDDRIVEIDDEALLPDQTRDDTDVGWGESPDRNDDRLLLEPPPHWG